MRAGIVRRFSTLISDSRRSIPAKATTSKRNISGIRIALSISLFTKWRGRGMTHLFYELTKSSTCPRNPDIDRELSPPFARRCRFDIPFSSVCLARAATPIPCRSPFLRPQARDSRDSRAGGKCRSFSPNGTILIYPNLARTHTTAPRRTATRMEIPVDFRDSVDHNDTLKPQTRHFRRSQTGIA